MISCSAIIQINVLTGLTACYWFVIAQIMLSVSFLAPESNDIHINER